MSLVDRVSRQLHVSLAVFIQFGLLRIFSCFPVFKAIPHRVLQFAEVNHDDIKCKLTSTTIKSNDLIANFSWNLLLLKHILECALIFHIRKKQGNAFHAVFLVMKKTRLIPCQESGYCNRIGQWPFVHVCTYSSSGIESGCALGLLWPWRAQTPLIGIKISRGLYCLTFLC